MTPTDDLCARLDELGIKHTTDDSNDYEIIEWQGPYNLWWEFVYDPYEEEPYGELRLVETGGATHLTPEQAIAATVGNRTDLSKRLREVSGLHAFAELFGFDWTDDSDWTWHDVACAMADAVDTATVGAGTCERIYHPNRITKKCTCSNCGYGASDERWVYCPKCGHKYVHGEVEEMMKAAGRKVAE